MSKTKVRAYPKSLIEQMVETSGTIIRPGEMWDAFSRTYLPDETGARLISSEVTTGRAPTRLRSVSRTEDRGRRAPRGRTRLTAC